MDAVGEPSSPAAAPGDGLVRGFWRLPAEIRNAIYEELLVTDCAFRLGHHGPYSHESRKKIYPAILRTCSAVHYEAIAILYGSNSFFLGPVGFKPTYSASFLTSIGSHNALLIRTIVAHSIHPSLLTRTYFSTWFNSLGLDFPALKIIAISFGERVEKPSVPSIPPAFHIPTNMPVLGSHWPQATIVSGPGMVGTPGVGTPNARQETEKAEVEEGEFEKAVTRTRGWLEKRKRADVEGLVALRNTDLRAGDDWLVYISPAVKKRMGRKIW